MIVDVSSAADGDGAAAVFAGDLLAVGGVGRRDACLYFSLGLEKKTFKGLNEK